jgi:hypothetical protein
MVVGGVGRLKGCEFLVIRVYFLPTTNKPRNILFLAYLEALRWI